MTLRTRILRLARQNPELGAALYPLLQKTAGAESFTNFVKVSDPKRAFRKAVEDARFEYGSGGYTGSIAEKSNYRVVAEPMTLREAQNYANRHIEQTDKYGPAHAIPVVQTSATKEKTVTLKVNARNQSEAVSVAQKDLEAKARGKSIEVDVKGVKQLRKGGKPQLEKMQPSESFFALARLRPGENPQLQRGWNTKTEAAKALEQYIERDQQYSGSGSAVWSIWQAKEVARVKVVGQASKLPVWEVQATVREVKKGSVIGYYFYGMAAS